MPSSLLGVGDGVNRPKWLGTPLLSSRLRQPEQQKPQTTEAPQNPSEVRDVRIIKESIAELSGFVTQYSQVVDLASLGANSTTVVDITTTSGKVAAGDYILFVGATLNHGLVVQGSIAAPAVDTIRLRISNLTAASIDAASTTFYFVIIKALST